MVGCVGVVGVWLLLENSVKASRSIPVGVSICGSLHGGVPGGILSFSVSSSDWWLEAELSPHWSKSRMRRTESGNATSASLDEDESVSSSDW